jgi:hypothetical protein
LINQRLLDQNDKRSCYHATMPETYRDDPDLSMYLKNNALSVNFFLKSSHHVKLNVFQYK